jgi:hypothetical protein
MFFIFFSFILLVSTVIVKIIYHEQKSFKKQKTVFLIGRRYYNGKRLW